MAQSAERVASEIEHAWNVLGRGRDVGSLESESDLCRDGVHGWCAAGHPLDVEEGCRSVCLDERCPLALQVREPAVYGQENGKELPLCLPRRVS